MAFTALYNACALYPAPMRDLPMHLALTDLFRGRWTNAIHDEWIRSVFGLSRAERSARPFGEGPRLDREWGG